MSGTAEPTEQTETDADPPEPPIRVFCHSDQDSLVIDDQQIAAAVRAVLADSDFQSAEVSVAIVDDATILDLNRRYLQHDYATDVLSFPLTNDNGHLEGELVISADTAVANAATAGWNPHDELMLYIIHGTLHLAGCDDADPADAAHMRDRECRHLEQLGIAISPSDERWPTSAETKSTGGAPQS